MKKLSDFSYSNSLTITACFLLFIFVPVILAAQSMAVIGDNTPFNDDGPYFFWHDDSLITWYYCQESLHISDQTFPTRKYFPVHIPEFRKEYTLSPEGYKPHFLNYSEVPRIFFISDIHGQFQILRQLLLKHYLIDEHDNWNWSNGHLVILGDIFDRGAEVTESLWLIHQLAIQAEEQGGKVHLLLGNHELMIVQGDYRYLNEKYHHLCDNVYHLEYREMFGVDSELGRWLRSCNIFLRINDILCLHAGISPELLSRLPSLSELNAAMHSYLNLAEIPDSLSAVIDFLTHSHGPLWFRGYFLENEAESKVTQRELDNILEKYKAEYMIIGHTTQANISALYEGKLLAIDAGIKYGDRGEALLWEKGVFYRLDLSGNCQSINIQKE